MVERAPARSSRPLRIGIACPEVPGHLNSLSALGLELITRGHTAVLVGGRHTAAYAQRRGVEFATVGAEGDRDEQLRAMVARLGSADGLRHARDMFTSIRFQTKIQIDELPAVIDEQRLDGMIVDTLAPGAAVAAQRAAVPFVVAHAAFISFTFVRTASSRSRGRPVRHGAHVAVERVASRVLPPIHRALRLVDPARPALLVVDSDLGLARISQQPEWFALPRPDLPAHFHYTGPWTRATAGIDSFDWDQLDGRPVVYASMGTVFNRRPDVFESILEAVEGLPVQLVMTRGGGDVEVPARLPDNALVVDFAPQPELLERASVCINHAGLSTVFECIERDVPMLCLPSSVESLAIADRVEAHGLGEILREPSPSPTEIRGRLEWLLSAPEPRRTAEEFGRRIRSVDGVAEAVDVTERAIATGERVLR